MTDGVATGELGFRVLSRQLEEYADRAEDFRPVWPLVGDLVSQAVGEQFATEGARFHTPWKPLDPDYKRWKIQQGWSSQTLVASGRMRDSFTSRPMAIERYYPDHADFGSDVEYAEYHQTGTSRGLPRRPIVDWEDETLLRDVDGVLQSYLDGEL